MAAVTDRFGAPRPSEVTARSCAPFWVGPGPAQPSTMTGQIGNLITQLRNGVTHFGGVDALAEQSI